MEDSDIVKDSVEEEKRAQVILIKRIYKLLRLLGEGNEVYVEKDVEAYSQVRDIGDSLVHF